MMRPGPKFTGLAGVAIWVADGSADSGEHVPGRKKTSMVNNHYL